MLHLRIDGSQLHLNNMKKFLAIVFVALLLLSASACQVSKTEPPVGGATYSEVASSETGINYSYQARFFMINDNHGAFTSSNDSTGVERIDTLLTMLENANGDYIKIANGDLLQGSYVSNSLRGRPMIEALNEMNFTCFVIGNHEFDWGIEEIAKYADGILDNGEAEFPFLGANIVYKESGKRPEWIEPYTIVEQNGLKVGIIGVIGDRLESSILSTKVEDYEFLPYTSMVGEYAAELREAGCDSVVLATHEYEQGTNNTIATLSDIQAIDAIFCAHTHQKINDQVARSDGYLIPVLQNYGNGGTASELILDYSSDNYPVVTSRQYNIRSYDLSVEMTQSVIERYREAIKSSEEIITELPNPLSKSELGVLACDSMKFEFSVDIGAINIAGVRATIDHTSVTAADLYKVFPFDNYIVLVTISGEQIKELYTRSGSFLYFNSDFDPSDFSDKDEYTVAVVDYVFESPYYTYVFDGSNYQYTAQHLRELMIEHFS